MSVEIFWRGEFNHPEVNELHFRAFRGEKPAASPWSDAASKHSLGWVTARDGSVLVGFINVVWDGGAHAWLQDVMVEPDLQHMGVGTRIVAKAREGAQSSSCTWLHVDFEARLRDFYITTCGFTPSEAGISNLRD